MISFKLYADTNTGLRDNNEDSFIVNRDLLQDNWEVPANSQEIISLGKRGCLMVVADGMGGMNAGEVASAIAIQTVKELFAPSKMPADVVNKPESIKAFIKKVIIEADRQVKHHCKEDPETEGMGSTIVMAWIVGGLAYVGWLGDSRAYSHLPGKGILRLTKDHSYVQELVDAKMLTEEEAMHHEQSNVITRSLGDASQKAKPDVISYQLSKDEIIMLCSDGLCGFCSDAEITGIIDDFSKDLKECHKALVNAALEAEGSDNITIALLQITEIEGDSGKILLHDNGTSKWKNIFGVFLACTIIAGFVIAWQKKCGRHEDVEREDTIKVDSDSLRTPKDTTITIMVDTQSNNTTTTGVDKPKDSDKTSLMGKAIKELPSDPVEEVENPEEELEIAHDDGDKSPEKIEE